MPLSPALAAWLTQQGYDTIHALHSGLAQASDPVILRRALEESRVVITADLDYPRLFALTHAWGPGLILLRGGNYTEQESLALVERVLASIPLNELTRSIVVADKTRLRKTPLPL